MDGALGGLPNDAAGKQLVRPVVDGGMRLAYDQRQLRRIDERRPAKGTEQPLCCIHTTGRNVLVDGESPSMVKSRM